MAPGPSIQSPAFKVLLVCLALSLYPHAIKFAPVPHAPKVPLLGGGILYSRPILLQLTMVPLVMVVRDMAEGVWGEAGANGAAQAPGNEYESFFGIFENEEFR